MQEDNRPPVQIRSAKFEDAERIAMLCKLLDYPTSKQEVQKRLNLLAEEEEHIIYIAYLLDEPVIGWVHVHALKSLVVGYLAVIGGLIVHPNYRGRGVGRLLMQFAEQWAKAQGCDSILVRSNVVRQEAHRFYEKIGYTQLKRQLVLHKKVS